MGRSQPPYPPEFRREAIRLVEAGAKSRNAIARDLGISTETLRQWVKQADIDAGIRQDGLTTAETEELRRLRREVRVLAEEREILRKAAAFFAKESGTPVSVFRFIAARKAEYSVKTMCRVLEVSRSGSTPGSAAGRPSVPSRTSG